MMPFKKVIFVDGDATARSVMAAAIMREEPVGKEIEVLARGLVVLFPEPVNQKIEAILANNNLTAKGHEAVQLTPEEIEADTLLLVMEQEQVEKVRELSPRAEHVTTVSAFAGFSGDIEPLYGADLPTCGKCFEILQGLVKIIAEKLLNEDEPPYEM
ncbi:MAG: hypothetical protein IJI10_04215 [Eubacterium sp.]|nr:hypothetical protein [Eubacterium sp.]